MHVKNAQIDCMVCTALQLQLQLVFSPADMILWLTAAVLLAGPRRHQGVYICSVLILVCHFHWGTWPSCLSVALFSLPCGPQVAPVRLRGRRGSDRPPQNITMLCFDSSSAESALQSVVEFSSRGSHITLVCE